ncbi:DUF736 domain-containing protein [Sphingobium sp. BS19]|uniref:DUF736 domain-containing protein n=1 Tax=Sphingobium sp. BS19 TaxID=3018973 RepID=UPI0022EE1DF0|nr:DUF736 domain-containing protein [Sphingobium sp. BS19]GLI98013.1 hypothetical protein Sbs19_18310 [Sphingobium sp. BS19]
MHIGTFEKVADGYAGHLRTLSLDVAVRILPVDRKPTLKAPDWRVVLADGEARSDIGAGWSQESAAAGAYIVLQLDCPTWPRPLRASLLQSDSDPATFVLLWSRRSVRSKEDRP